MANPVATQAAYIATITTANATNHCHGSAFNVARATEPSVSKTRPNQANDEAFSVMLAPLKTSAGRDAAQTIAMNATARVPNNSACELRGHEVNGCFHHGAASRALIAANTFVTRSSGASCSGSFFNCWSMNRSSSFCSAYPVKAVKYLLLFF